MIAATTDRHFSPLFIGEITSTKNTKGKQAKSLNFSPLFIGEITSTRKAYSRQKRPGSFQSPLHRGNHFNLRSAALRLAPRRYFSPLFIGEITSTLQRHPHPPCSRYISVPSSSGKSLQRNETLTRMAGAMRISVPSSSGKSLQQIISDFKMPPEQNFSPLFIGEITST